MWAPGVPCPPVGLALCPQLALGQFTTAFLGPTLASAPETMLTGWGPEPVGLRLLRVRESTAGGHAAGVRAEPINPTPGTQSSGTRLNFQVAGLCPSCLSALGHVVISHMLGPTALSFSHQGYHWGLSVCTTTPPSNVFVCLFYFFFLKVREK